MSSFIVSRVDSVESLMTLEDIIGEWKEKIKVKRNMVFRHAVENRTKEVLLDAASVVELIQKAPLRSYSSAYVPTGRESAEWKLDRELERAHEIYVAFDKDGNAQGIAVLVRTFYTKRVAALKCLLTNPDAIGIFSNFGKVQGVGTSMVRHIAFCSHQVDPNTEFVVSAYQSARGFYEKCGFVADVAEESEHCVHMKLSDDGKQKLLRQWAELNLKITQEPPLVAQKDQLPYPQCEHLAEAIGQAVGPSFDARIHHTIGQFLFH